MTTKSDLSPYCNQKSRLLLSPEDIFQHIKYMLEYSYIDRSNGALMSKNSISQTQLFLILTFLIFSLFQSQEVFAKITLLNGTYTNRTHIDPALRTANLNFKYVGCDQNPSPSKIRLSTNGDCKDASPYFLERDGNNTSIAGTVGEILATYYDDSAVETNCTEKVTRTLTSNYSISNLYEQLEQKGCKPTHLVVRDSDQSDFNHYTKATGSKALCKLKDTKITKDGFPTDELSILNMRANKDSFKIGSKSQYRFDNEKGWCIKYASNDEKCGTWPSPVPLAYHNKTTGNFHLKGVIRLGNDGKASIHAIDKAYKSKDQMFNDLKNGGASPTDASKGHIEYHTWTKGNGIKRAIVRSYDASGAHQRSINFFARNVFGRDATRQWCSGEHCFVDVERPPLQQHSCPNTPEVDLDNGGSGNLCFSCIGITPGLCSIKEDDVKVVKERLGEDDSFHLTTYGEYALESSTSLDNNLHPGTLALRKKFAQMISRPPYPGCHKGNAPERREAFDPSTDESSEDRSIIQRVVNSVESVFIKKKKSL